MSFAEKCVELKIIMLKEIRFRETNVYLFPLYVESRLKQGQKLEGRLFRKG